MAMSKTKAITGVVVTPFCFKVPAGKIGEIILDGSGSVVRVARVATDNGSVKTNIEDLSNPDARNLEPGVYEFTVPTFGDNFNLYYGLVD